MRKPSTKKLLFIVGSLLLILAAFVVGGVAISSSVQAASPNTQNRSAAQSGKGSQQGTLAKAVVVVNSVAGNRIQASYLEPLDKKGHAVTVITTSSTTYTPNRGIVAAGKTLFVFGVVHSDGSITAQAVGFYDPTLAYFGGDVTKIDGSTVTTQAKGSTHIIHLTASTTFLMGQPKSKSTQPASRSDIKVGVIIEARGKLNSDGSLTAAEVLIMQPDSVTK